MIYGISNYLGYSVRQYKVVGEREVGNNMAILILSSNAANTMLRQAAFRDAESIYHCETEE